MINYDHKVVPTCIQSYKASTLVNYEYRVAMTRNYDFRLVVNYDPRLIISLTTELLTQTGQIMNFLLLKTYIECYFTKNFCMDLFLFQYLLICMGLFNY